MVEPECLGTPAYLEEFCKMYFPKERPLTIIEVGSWKGASAFKMISACDKKCKIYCVDNWIGGVADFKTISRNENGFPNIFDEFWTNVKNAGYEDIITPITLVSVDGAEVLKEAGVQADVIYIDARHDYKGVTEDLNVYWPLLKKGGLFFGDDFSSDFFGVIGAVQHFAFDVGIPFQVVSNKTWFMFKK